MQMLHLPHETAGPHTCSLRGGLFCWAFFPPLWTNKGISYPAKAVDHHIYTTTTAKNKRLCYMEKKTALGEASCSVVQGQAAADLVGGLQPPSQPKGLPTCTTCPARK